MNATNRMIAILLIALLTAIGIVVAVTPVGAFEWVKGSFGWLSYHTNAYGQAHKTTLVALQIAGGIVVLLLGLLLLWLELRRPRKKTVRAQKLAGGESFIAIDSIEQRLAYTIDQLPDVVKVLPRVVDYGRNGLELDLGVETAPEIDVPMKTEEVLQVAKEVITERMGLKLGKVQVKIKHAPYPNP